MSALVISESTALTGRRSALAGAGGLVFVVLVVVQNVLRAVLGPAAGASPAEVAELTHAHAWSVHLLVVTYLLAFPALLAFAVGLSAWCTRATERATVWAGMGQASTIVVAVLFGLVNILQVTMVAARDRLDAAADLAPLLWTLHNAVFTINLVAVGVALLGLGRAAAIAGLVPRWLGPASAIGAALLIASALPAVAVTRGSAWLGVGLVGFVVWLIFLAVAGWALLRPAPR